MADIANLKIGNNLYSIKDPTARTTASNADTKADQAIIDASQAQATANSADTKATNANTKIDGTNLIGTYTSGTETLEISLEIGTISSGTSGT